MSTQTATLPSPTDSQREQIRWLHSLPFFAVHAMCLFAFSVGANLRDVLVCIGLYYLRMFAITAGYHRYFSHRAYKMGRVPQFLMALLGTTATQKGPLWWAGHHRHHHRFSDMDEDIHSPTLKGFWWSHVGWILSAKYDATPSQNIRDFERFPELRLLNRFHLVPPVLLAVALYFIGGFSLLVWGFFVSTTLLWHGTFTINSLSHIFGNRRYKTTDTSKNNWLLALITCGEGWHNNHHYHQNTANQGWFWWEVDFSFYALKALSWVGVVSDLRLPPQGVKLAHLKYTEEQRAAINGKTTFKAGRTSEAVDRAQVAASDAVDRMKEAIHAAADKLPSGPSPSPLLKR